jgi:hypothetical protein
MFAIATRLKSERNLSFGFGDLLSEAALARHRAVGGHARCPAANLNILESRARICNTREIAEESAADLVAGRIA